MSFWHPLLKQPPKADKRCATAGIPVIDGEYIDPLKMVILLSETGADGNLVEADLLAANIDLEMANKDVIIPMITLADTPQRIENSGYSNHCSGGEVSRGTKTNQDCSCVRD